MPGPVSPPAEGPDQHALQSIASAARSNLVSAPRRRFKPSTSVLDLFDWKFEKYLTPWIVRATWVVVVALSGIWLLLITMGLLMSLIPSPEPSTSGQRSTRIEGTFSRPPRPTAQFRSPELPNGAQQYVLRNAIAVMTYVTGIIGLGLFLLWMRVLLESLIVLFNIAESLTNIDRRIAKAVRRE